MKERETAGERNAAKMGDMVASRVEFRYTIDRDTQRGVAAELA